MGLTTGAVTRVIDRLEQAGYVRRVPDPADRRRVIVEVVPDKVAGVKATLGRVGEASTNEIGLQRGRTRGHQRLPDAHGRDHARGGHGPAPDPGPGGRGD